MATDLRASACLVIAGLVAAGSTTINRIYHLVADTSASRTNSALGADPPRGVRRSCCDSPMTDLKDSPLGHSTTWTSAYDRSCCFRSSAYRSAAARDRRCVALSRCRCLECVRGFLARPAWQAGSCDRDLCRDGGIPIVESKSVKLYLTALNMTRFASRDAVTETIAVTFRPPPVVGGRCDPHGAGGFRGLAACRTGRRMSRHAAAFSDADDKAPVPGGAGGARDRRRNAFHGSFAPYARLRATGLCERRDPLFGRAHRPNRAPAISFRFAAAGFLRTLRRTNLCRHPAALRAHCTCGARPLHATRRHRHQSVAYERPGTRAHQRANSAAVIVSSEPA